MIIVNEPQSDDETKKNPELLSEATPPLPPRPPPPPPPHPMVQYGRSTSPAPPRYSFGGPTQTAVFEFVFQPNSAMVLVPTNATLSELSALYYITVSMNCFTPTSHITTIRRGGIDGPFFGDFEIGLETKTNFFNLRGFDYVIDDVLSARPGLFRNTWTWRCMNNDHKSLTLHWDDFTVGNGTLTCFLSRDRTGSTLLAKFSPRVPHFRSFRSNPRPPDNPKLEVTPQGHEVFDDILMSVLIIERLRTSPRSMR